MLRKSSKWPKSLILEGLQSGPPFQVLRPSNFSSTGSCARVCTCAAKASKYDWSPSVRRSKKPSLALAPEWHGAGYGFRMGTCKWPISCHGLAGRIMLKCVIIHMYVYYNIYDICIICVYIRIYDIEGRFERPSRGIHTISHIYKQTPASSQVTSSFKGFRLSFPGRGFSSRDLAGDKKNGHCIDGQFSMTIVMCQSYRVVPLGDAVTWSYL